MTTGRHMFLGTFFLLVGITILLKAFFHIDIPLVRTAFGIFVVYIGIKMLIGGFGWNHKNEWNSRATLFNSQDFKWTEDDEKGRKQYSVVFGSNTIDLTDLPADSNDVNIEVSTVFGESKVLLSRKTPFRIRANAVFGEAKIPDDSMVAFGSLRYENPDQKSAPNRLLIHGNVVFGSLKFEYRD